MTGIGGVERSRPLPTQCSLMIFNYGFLKNTNTIINAIPENIPQEIKPRFIEIFAIFPIDRFVIEAMMSPAIA